MINFWDTTKVPKEWKTWKHRHSMCVYWGFEWRTERNIVGKVNFRYEWPDRRISRNLLLLKQWDQICPSGVIANIPLNNKLLRLNKNGLFPPLTKSLSSHSGILHSTSDPQEPAGQRSLKLTCAQLHTPSVWLQPIVASPCSRRGHGETSRALPRVRQPPPDGRPLIIKQRSSGGSGD